MSITSRLSLVMHGPRLELLARGGDIGRRHVRMVQEVQARQVRNGPRARAGPCGCGVARQRQRAQPLQRPQRRHRRWAVQAVAPCRVCPNVSVWSRCAAAQTPLPCPAAARMLASVQKRGAYSGHSCGALCVSRFALRPWQTCVESQVSGRKAAALAPAALINVTFWAVARCCSSCISQISRSTSK